MSTFTQCNRVDQSFWELVISGGGGGGALQSQKHDAFDGTYIDGDCPYLFSVLEYTL